MVIGLHGLSQPDVPSSSLFVITAISAPSMSRFKSAYQKGLARFASMNAFKACSIENGEFEFNFPGSL